MQNESNSKYLLELAGNGILAGAFVTFVYYLYFYQPVAYVFFVAEDSWSEFGTFLFWLFTFSMVAWALVKYREFRKPGHFAFALVAFLIAMEEISWGQRIFQIETPSFFQANNYQGELSIHNLAETGQYYPYIGPLLLLGGFVLPVIVGLSVKLKYYCSRLGVPVVSTRHWPFFILPIYFLDYTNYVIPIIPSHELAEFSLAVAVSVMTLDWVMKLGWGHRAFGATAVRATIGMIATGLILTAPLVRLSDYAPRYLWVYVNEYLDQRMYRQAGLVLDYIDRHPQYLEKDSHYYHGLVLLKLGRNEEAKQILEKALHEQEQQQQMDPESPEPFRKAGKILHLLDRIPAAETAYLKAVNLGREQLRTVCDPETEAKLRWSLAKSFVAMGRYDAADEQIRQVVEIAPFRSVQRKIRRWMRDERRDVADLWPSEMASIKTDFPPIPKNQQGAKKWAGLDTWELKWSLRVAGGNVAKLVCPPDAPGVLRIAIEKVKSKFTYDIQLNHPRLKVRSNQVYRVQLRARSDSPRSIFLGFALAHEPWTGLGLYRELALTPEWQSFQEDFTATGSDNNGRIHFDLGGSDISIDLSGVVLSRLQDDRERRN